MAAVFDTTSYPLANDTRVKRDPAIARDILDDGSMQIRVLGNEYAVIEMVFMPMSATTAQAFETYIVTNRATELEVTVRGTTYRGYLWSELKGDGSKGPNVVMYEIDFRGIAL